MLYRGLHNDCILRAGSLTGATADTVILIENPGLGLAVNHNSLLRALLCTEGAVDALGGVVDGLAVIPRLNGSRSFGRLLFGASAEVTVLAAAAAAGAVSAGFAAAGAAGFAAAGFGAGFFFSLKCVPVTMRSSSFVAII